MPHLVSPTRRVSAALRPSWEGALDDHVVDLAWSADGVLLAAAAVSGALGVWYARSGSLTCALTGHRLGAMALAWRPDAAVLASAGQDGAVRLWDGATGALKHELAAGAPWVSCVCWCPSPGGRRPPYLAAGAGRTVRFWHPSGERLRDIGDLQSTVADIRWHSSRGELAVAVYGGLVLCMPGTEMASGAADLPDAPRVLRWQGSSLALAWSPDGRFIAAGGQDATVHFWITATGKDLQMWGYPTKVRELSWDAPSRYLATGGGPDVTIWDCGGEGPSGTKPIQLQGSGAPLAAVAYQHRGSLLASACEDGVLTLWWPARGVRPLAEVKVAAPISRIAWSPDDRHIAVACADGSLHIYGVTT